MVVVTIVGQEVATKRHSIHIAPGRGAADDADTQIKYWTFKNARINGALLDAALLADPTVFTTTNVSDMIFEP